MQPEFSNSSEKDKLSSPRTSDIRTELVARIRREIAAGEYDTPERWDETLDRLCERLWQQA